MENQPSTSVSDPTRVFVKYELPRTSEIGANLSEMDRNISVKIEDEKSGQYRNLSENYTKLKTTFSGEMMKAGPFDIDKSSTSFSASHKMQREISPSALEVKLDVGAQLENHRDKLLLEDFNDFPSHQKDEQDSPEEMKGGGEEDEFVSSILSVHFDAVGDDNDNGGQRPDNILGKLQDKNFSADEATGEKVSDRESNMVDGTRVSLELGTGNDTTNTSVDRGWKTTIAATSSVNPAPSTNQMFSSRFPRVKRQRQRPPPKTATMYNAELTTIATADQICLNIRLKERREKHERWKKFPHEKTKYRKQHAIRKAEVASKKKKDKDEGKPKKKQKKKKGVKEEEKEAPAPTTSSNNNSGADGEFAYQCQYCGMGFAHHSRLKLHERCHTGEKPYPCPFCDKAFSQNGYLKTHLKIHTGEKPFQCSICDYSFRLSTTLNRHMRVHTGECPFTCPICSRSFNQKSTLSKHIKVHSEDRPHICPVCNKGFRLIDTLRTHQQIHEEVRSFICSVCDKAFKTKGTLLSHMKTHTRKIMNDDGELYDNIQETMTD